MNAAPRPRERGAFNTRKLCRVEPDQAYEYTIEFWRQPGNVFARGRRIRIEISNSY